MLSFVQAHDFVLRLRLTSKKEWKEWSKSGQRPCNVPSHPRRAYKRKGWVSYPDWMGYQYTKGDQSRKEVLPFHSARDAVRKLQLTSQKEWWEWSKSGQRPSNVPSHPAKAYKGKGWVSWPDWMGYQYTKGDQSKKEVLLFHSARDAVRKLQLTSHKEWEEWSKSGQRPCNVPGRPDKVYKGKGWVSWPDWMGYQYKKGDQNKKELLPFHSARDVVRKLQLTSKTEWEEWRKSGQRPSNVPSSPDQVYKGKGWVSWPDWMGYKYTKGDKQNRRKRKRIEQSKSSSACSSSSSSSSSPPVDNCVICFEPLCPVTTEIGHLSCVHTFHVDCLNGHARASATPSTTSRRGVLLNCPLCRKRSRWLPPLPT
eukprot:g857.t1